MTVRFENNKLTIDGFENGIGNSPYNGFADMRNVEIIEDSGEISVAFKAGAVTLPPIFNAVSYTGTASTDRVALASVTGLYEGCAVVLAANTATGLTNAIVYYVRNISALTFQLSVAPNSPIINITVDGGGTLTTYQYGNQRALVNNGSPVSYYAAPEIGGVLLSDSSNYVWLWQQGTGGNSPINTVLFLGNIGGIGAETGNQTGVSYWNGHVVLVRQPSVINVLNWETFTSSSVPSDWNYTGVRSEEALRFGLTLDTAVPSYTIGYVYNPSGPDMPIYQSTDRVFAAGSSSTITSNTIDLKQGDVVVAFVYTWNNQSVTSATFAGNAMTSYFNNNDSFPYNFGIRVLTYTALADISGVIIGTYGGAVTNRLVSAVVVRNMSTVVQSGSGRSESSSVLAYADVEQTKPNQFGVFFATTSNTTDLAEVASSILVQAQNQIEAAVGHDWLYYYSDGHGASNTLKRNVPITVAENNTLYWGDGEQFLASLNQNAGEIFVPNDITTYTYSSEAFDIPESDIIQSVQMSASTLFVGADSKRLYPWDTISPSFDAPITFPEPAITDFVATNNLLYAFAGNKGRIYLTNSSSATLYQQLPNGITLTERPFYFFWDANVGNNELYFTFQSFTNNDPDTPLANNEGVWAINSDTNALRMVQRTINPNAWVRMALPVADGFTQELLRPPGQGLLVGYSVGAAHYLDYSVSEPHTDYSAYFETEIIPVGTFFSKTTFEKIEYKLATPMVQGESIRISQRSNLSSAYSVIAEFTLAGVISSQSSINWQNVEWVQLKIEMKSVASSPSYVRIKEVTIH